MNMSTPRRKQARPEAIRPGLEVPNPKAMEGVTDGKTKAMRPGLKALDPKEPYDRNAPSLSMGGNESTRSRSTMMERKYVSIAQSSS